MSTRILSAGLLGGLASVAWAAAPEPKIASRIAENNPDLSPAVLQVALASLSCAEKSGVAKGERWLTIIDYSLPSTEPRLWVLDLESGEVAFRERVAHGRNTGENQATSFSNSDGSLQSSIGLFRTAETYTGSNGYSLRLDGLEQGINDRARERHIVIHGASYVSEDFIAKTGRPVLPPGWSTVYESPLEPGTLLQIREGSRPVVDRRRTLR